MKCGTYTSPAYAALVRKRRIVAGSVDHLATHHIVIARLHYGRRGLDLAVLRTLGRVDQRELRRAVTTRDETGGAVLLGEGGYGAEEVEEAFVLIAMEALGGGAWLDFDDHCLLEVVAHNYPRRAY